MIRNTIKVLVIASLVCVLMSGSSDAEMKKVRRRIVCYYTNWSVYRQGNGRFLPSNIDPHLCTHLIYAFAGIDSDFRLKPFDNYQDIEKGGYTKFNALKRYNPRLKTMLGVGGWQEGSARFSKFCSDPDLRRRFIYSVVEFLRQHNFDGLDLDWEFPGSRAGSHPDDKANYAALCQELRWAFESESSQTNRPRLLLSMAVPAGVDTITAGYDIPAINGAVDFFNVLGYDYHSTNESQTGHHAPLFAAPGTSPFDADAQLNVDYTIRYYIHLGAERRKLVLGIPTYGRSYELLNNSPNGLQAPAIGPGLRGKFTAEDGYLSYYEICELDGREDWSVVHPFPEEMGPYATGGMQWVSYDDEEIVRRKGKYARENYLGGIMIWSLDNDDFRGLCSSRPFPLIQAAKEAYLSSREREAFQKQEAVSTSPLKMTSSTTEGVFECVREGFVGHPEFCDRYFWCLRVRGHGILAHPFTCPAGLHFNKNSDGCDYPENVNCRLETSKVPTEKVAAHSESPTAFVTPSIVEFHRFYTERQPGLNYDEQKKPRISRTNYQDLRAVREHSTYLKDFRTTRSWSTEQPPQSNPEQLKKLLDLIVQLGGVEKVRALMNSENSDDVNQLIDKEDRQTLNSILRDQDTTGIYEQKSNPLITDGISDKLLGRLADNGQDLGSETLAISASTVHEVFSPSPQLSASTIGDAVTETTSDSPSRTTRAANRRVVVRFRGKHDAQSESEGPEPTSQEQVVRKVKVVRMKVPKNKLEENAAAALTLSTVASHGEEKVDLDDPRLPSEAGEPQALALVTPTASGVSYRRTVYRGHQVRTRSSTTTIAAVPSRTSPTDSGEKLIQSSAASTSDDRTISPSDSSSSPQFKEQLFSGSGFGVTEKPQQDLQSSTTSGNHEGGALPAVRARKAKTIRKIIRPREQSSDQVIEPVVAAVVSQESTSANSVPENLRKATTSRQRLQPPQTTSFPLTTKKSVGKTTLRRLRPQPSTTTEEPATSTSANGDNDKYSGTLQTASWLPETTPGASVLKTTISKTQLRTTIRPPTTERRRILSSNRIRSRLRPSTRAPIAEVTFETQQEDVSSITVGPDITDDDVDQQDEGSLETTPEPRKTTTRRIRKRPTTLSAGRRPSVNFRNTLRPRPNRPKYETTATETASTDDFSATSKTTDLINEQASLTTVPLNPATDNRGEFATSTVASTSDSSETIEIFPTVASTLPTRAATRGRGLINRLSTSVSARRADISARRTTLSSRSRIRGLVYPRVTPTLAATAETTNAPVSVETIRTENTRSTSSPRDFYSTRSSLRATTLRKKQNERRKTPSSILSRTDSSSRDDETLGEPTPSQEPANSATQANRITTKPSERASRLSSTTRRLRLLRLSSLPTSPSNIRSAISTTRRLAFKTSHKSPTVTPGPATSTTPTTTTSSDLDQTSTVAFEEHSSDVLEGSKRLENANRRKSTGLFNLRAALQSDRHTTPKKKDWAALLASTIQPATGAEKDSDQEIYDTQQELNKYERYSTVFPKATTNSSPNQSISRSSIFGLGRFQQSKHNSVGAGESRGSSQRYSVPLPSRTTPLRVALDDMLVGTTEYPKNYLIADGITARSDEFVHTIGDSTLISSEVEQGRRTGRLLSDVPSRSSASVLRKPITPRKVSTLRAGLTNAVTPRSIFNRSFTTEFNQQNPISPASNLFTSTESYTAAPGEENRNILTGDTQGTTTRTRFSEVAKSSRNDVGLLDSPRRAPARNGFYALVRNRGKNGRDRVKSLVQRLRESIEKQQQIPSVAGNSGNSTISSTAEVGVNVTSSLENPTLEEKETTTTESTPATSKATTAISVNDRVTASFTTEGQSSSTESLTKPNATTDRPPDTWKPLLTESTSNAPFTVLEGTTSATTSASSTESSTVMPNMNVTEGSISELPTHVANITTTSLPLDLIPTTETSNVILGITPSANPSPNATTTTDLPNIVLNYTTSTSASTSPIKSASTTVSRIPETSLDSFSTPSSKSLEQTSPTTAATSASTSTSTTRTTLPVDLQEVGTDEAKSRATSWISSTTEWILSATLSDDETELVFVDSTQTSRVPSDQPTSTEAATFSSALPTKTPSSTSSSSHSSNEITSTSSMASTSSSAAISSSQPPVDQHLQKITAQPSITTGQNHEDGIEEASQKLPLYDHQGVLAYSTVTPRYRNPDGLFKGKTYQSSQAPLASTYALTATCISMLFMVFL